MDTYRITKSEIDNDGYYIGTTDVANYDGHLEIEMNLGWVRFRGSVRVSGGLGIEAGSGIKAGEGIEAGSGIKAGSGI